MRGTFNAEHHGRLLPSQRRTRPLQLRCWPTTPRRKWTRCWSTTERGRRRTPRRPAPVQLCCWPTTPWRKWTRSGQQARRTHRRRLPSRVRCLPDGPGPGRFHDQPDHLSSGGVPPTRTRQRPRASPPPWLGFAWDDFAEELDGDQPVGFQARLDAGCDLQHPGARMTKR